MSKESKRIKLDGIKGTPIDVSNWYENRKKQELAEQERKQKGEELEKERIDKIECPVCKSNDKIHHVKTKNNGIMGPGFSSWVTDEYLICKNCGVHYTDITKFK